MKKMSLLLCSLLGGLVIAFECMAADTKEINVSPEWQSVADLARHPSKRAKGINPSARTTKRGVKQGSSLPTPPHMQQGAKLPTSSNMNPGATLPTSPNIPKP